jgi:hypothetical protein
MNRRCEERETLNFCNMSDRVYRHEEINWETGKGTQTRNLIFCQEHWGCGRKVRPDKKPDCITNGCSRNDWIEHNMCLVRIMKRKDKWGSGVCHRPTAVWSWMSSHSPGSLLRGHRRELDEVVSIGHAGIKSRRDGAQKKTPRRFQGGFHAYFIHLQCLGCRPLSSLTDRTDAAHLPNRAPRYNDRTPHFLVGRKDGKRGDDPSFAVPSRVSTKSVSQSSAGPKYQPIDVHKIV